MRLIRFRNENHEDGSIYHYSSKDITEIVSNVINDKPNTPLCRVINKMSSYRCLNCGSSSFKTGFLRLFGERLCLNNKCKNSIKRFKKL